MKNKKGFQVAIFPFVLTVCLYVVFYSRIESKPEHAGFWFIFIMGMSFGVALTRFFVWLNEKKQDNK